MRKTLLSIFLALIIIIQGALFSSCNDTTNVKDFEYEEVSGGINITKYIGSATKVVVPSVIENKKVISINDNVFSGNIVLKEITLPESLNSTDFKLFKNCDSLEKITFLNKSNTISSYTQDLKSLHTIEFSEIPTSELRTINSLIFYMRALKNIKISKITNLDKYTSFNISRDDIEFEKPEIVDRNVNISVPEELNQMIISAKAERRYSLIKSDDSDTTYYVYTDNIDNMEKTIDVDVPNNFKSSVIKAFADKGYSLNSDFKIYTNNGNSNYYYIKGIVNNSQIMCSVELSKTYQDNGSYKLHLEDYTYGNYYYNPFDNYPNKATTVEKIDNIANMCIYFSCNNVTVNGVNYKYDFK